MKTYLLGANNPEAVRMITAVKRAMPNAEFAFLDNDPAKKDKLFYGIPVIGGVDRVEALNGEDVRFVNLITRDCLTRLETTRQLVQAGGRLTNFIHPTCDMTMVGMGVGNYVQESVILQAQVCIGDNSSLSAGCVVGHETRIGNTVFFAPGVKVAGCVDIDDGAFFGINATVLPRLRIGRWSVVGAGAVVTADVPDYAVVVGNPARVIRLNPAAHAHGRVFE